MPGFPLPPGKRGLCSLGTESRPRCPGRMDHAISLYSPTQTPTSTTADYTTSKTSRASLLRSGQVSTRLVYVPPQRVRYRCVMC